MELVCVLHLLSLCPAFFMRLCVRVCTELEPLQDIMPRVENGPEEDTQHKDYSVCDFSFYFRRSCGSRCSVIVRYGAVRGWMWWVEPGDLTLVSCSCYCCCCY